MGELRAPRKADAPDRLASHHPIAGLHADAPLVQMAILRFPAIAMRNDHAVAAFAALDGWNVRISDRDVGHAVTPAQHLPVRGRKHVHTGSLRG